jgi:hypothetical protein
MGEEFGPFPSSTMKEWFQQDYFPMQGELLVRVHGWESHFPISKLYPEPLHMTAFNRLPQVIQAIEEEPPSNGLTIGPPGSVSPQSTPPLFPMSPVASLSSKGPTYKPAVKRKALCEPSDAQDAKRRLRGRQNEAEGNLMSNCRGEVCGEVDENVRIECTATPQSRFPCSASPK